MKRFNLCIYLILILLYLPNVNATIYLSNSVYPDLENQTEWNVLIQNEDDYNETYFEIDYIINNRDCNKPSISFIYELIDFDKPYEYLQIYDIIIMD